MPHPVVLVTKKRAAAAIEGLDPPDKVPWVVVCLLRPSAQAGPAREAEPVVQGASLSRLMTDLAHV